MVRKIVERTWERLTRDRGVPLTVLARKGAVHLSSLATAPVWLLGVSKVGAGVRTVGRPRVENLGRMEIGDHVTLRSVPVPVELVTGVGGVLTVGDDTFLNYGSSIAATGEVRIGRHVNVGPYVMIIDTTYHDPYDRSRVPPPRPVIIEDHVFIGAKCSVMPGVRIGEGAIVAANSVVTHDVAPFTVVAGVPAKQVSTLDPARFVRR